MRRVKNYLGTRRSNYQLLSFLFGVDYILVVAGSNVTLSLCRVLSHGSYLPVITSVISFTPTTQVVAARSWC